MSIRRRVSHYNVRRNYQKKINQLEKENANLTERLRKLEFNYQLLLDFHYFSLESHLEGNDVKNRYKFTD
jgi:predicted nuclease with TOPRIM domain